MLEALFIPAIVILTAFLSGLFETWITKQCTWCGAGGKMMAISHHGAIGLGQGFRHPLQSVSWGVIHENIVCKLCYDRWIWDSCWADVSDSIKKHLSPRP